MSTNTTPNFNTSLSSLALLSLQLGEGKDYLDYLSGFVIEALHQLNSPSFDSVAVQALIQSEFGLKIPAATIAIYLKRLQKAKVVQRTPDGHQFRIVNLPPSSIGGDREATRGRINEVIRQLKAFAADRYERNWTEEEAAAGLTAFVRDYSIDFVRFSEFRSPLPEPAASSASEHFIIASFIQHCAQDAPGTFESVKTLVESHILANALLCPDLQDKGSGFKDVVFVLDTRLMLKAFDLEAPIDTENTRGLLETVRRLKGILRIFPDTKEEIRAVLQGIIRGYQHGGARGPIVEELRKRGRGIADVLLAEANLEENLTSLNISTLQSPPYDERTYRFQIDEESLRAELEEELGYALGRAADHDVHVVRSIFALRKGRRISRIEDSGFVFLTTNTALSRAAFHQQRAENQGWVFSSVITDYHLSHLAWLKSPMQSGDLARTEILSSCHAAMRPAQTVWRRYIAEVDRLKAEGRFSERDHEVLRLSLNASEELMDVTRGEVDGITEQNLRAILTRLEESYAADKEEKLKQERFAHESTMTTLAEREQALVYSQKEKAAAEERESQLQAEKAKAEEELKQLKSFEEQARAREAARTERINQIAERTARIAFVVSAFLFVTVGVMALLSNLSPWLGIPAAIVGFFNLWIGFSGNMVERAVKEWVARRLSQFMN